MRRRYDCLSCAGCVWKQTLNAEGRAVDYCAAYDKPITNKPRKTKKK